MNLNFPGVREPGKNQMKRIWEKQVVLGTVKNCNSKTSPGNTYSGRPKTQRTPAKKIAIKNVLDRDSEKQMGDATVSPVSSARKNVLAIPKSSWSRISSELHYHPYKPIRRQELQPGDYQRRINFCHWLVIQKLIRSCLNFCSLMKHILN